MGCNTRKKLMLTLLLLITAFAAMLFAACELLTIYCGASEQPIGWSEKWNPSDCPVVLGYLVDRAKRLC